MNKVQSSVLVTSALFVQELDLTCAESVRRIRLVTRVVSDHLTFSSNSISLGRRVPERVFQWSTITFDAIHARDPSPDQDTNVS